MSGAPSLPDSGGEVKLPSPLAMKMTPRPCETLNTEKRAAPICGCAGLLRMTVPAVWLEVNVIFWMSGGGSGTDGV